MSADTVPEHRTDVLVSILLASAAVVAAALGGRAAMLSDRGSDTYSASIRQHAKQAAATVEDVRYVYDDEAVFALRVAQAELRAEELRRQARRLPPAEREAVIVEAVAQEQVAEISASVSELATDEYRLEGGGFDLPARLADQRNRYPDLVALDPDRPEDEGARLALHASLDVASTIPVAVAFLFGSLSHAFPRRRRGLVYAGFAFLVVGLAAGIALEIAL